MSKREQQRSKQDLILIGIVSIVLGIIMLLNPTGVARFVVMAVGVVLLVLGIVTFIGYIRDGDSSSQVDLFTSIIEIIFGIVLLMWPDMFVNWLVVIIGAFILVAGVGDLSDANIAMRIGAPFSTGKMVLAIITIVLGFLVIVSPFAFVNMAFTIAGVCLLVNGITELISAFK